MALVLADRVKETSSFTGTTSPITLLGAATGFQSFAAVGNGNTTFYSITNPGTNEWEPTTLIRANYNSLVYVVV